MSVNVRVKVWLGGITGLLPRPTTLTKLRMVRSIVDQPSSAGVRPSVYLSLVARKCCSYRSVLGVAFESIASTAMFALGGLTTLSYRKSAKYASKVEDELECPQSHVDHMDVRASSVHPS